MDLVVGLLWLLAFSVIVLFLGALNYFLGRSHSDIETSGKKSSQLDSTNQQQQSNRNTTSNNRRKQARNANKKQRQLAVAAAAAGVNENLNSDDNKEKSSSISSETKSKEEESSIESSIQQTDEEQESKEEFEDPIEIEEVHVSAHVEDEQKPALPAKQRNKNKSNPPNSESANPSKEESLLPLKPQASIAPVKQSLLPVPSTNTESTQTMQDNHSKSNGSTSQRHIYSYGEQKSLPPRFQQQQREGNIRQRKTTDQNKKFSNPSISPRTSRPQQNNDNHFECSLQSSDQNGYSSESDLLTESSSIAPPSSNEPQHPLRRSDLLCSLSSSQHSLNELVSIFDTTSFSSDELELLLNKITKKHLSNKAHRQQVSSSSPMKNGKTIERLLDETYHSQAKVLAIELQTEKNRVFELTKLNGQMGNTIRQLQQPNNNNLAAYQQAILHYQMQIKRLTDDNAHLIHQLHAYSVMPASINELKQQQSILDEQLRQITMRNSNLEKEIADGQRATIQAAEIYKKADMKKQERIDQMNNDLNKYKKIDKDFRALQAKHVELEKSLNSKLDTVTTQRDDLQKSYEELNDKIEQYEPLKNKYDELFQHSSSTSTSNELQEELNEVKTKNDILRQRNWKIMEQLNKLTAEQD